MSDAPGSFGAMSASPTPIPPPPPPDMFQSASNYQDPQTPQTPYQVVPDFARPQKGAASRTGRRFFLVMLVMLVLIVTIGGTVYYIRAKGNTANAGQGDNNSANSYKTASSANTPTSTTPTPATTSSAGTVTFLPALIYVYANVKVSILDVQQASSFSDDSSYYSNPGVLRLDVKEESQTIDGGFYNYSYDSLRLVTANGTTF